MFGARLLLNERVSALLIRPMHNTKLHLIPNPVLGTGITTMKIVEFTSALWYYMNK